MILTNYYFIRDLGFWGVWALSWKQVGLPVGLAKL